MPRNGFDFSAVHRQSGGEANDPLFATLRFNALRHVLKRGKGKRTHDNEFMTAGVEEG